MEWLDIIIIVGIAVSTFLGFRAGIIKAVLSLAGLIIGIILAGRYYEALSEELTFISQPGVAKVVAFIIILVVVAAAAALLARLLKWATSLMMLGWVNHLGGAVFGFLLGAVLWGALLAIWIKFFGIGGAMADSSVAAILLDRFPLVLRLLPEEFGAIRSFFN